MRFFLALAMIVGFSLVSLAQEFFELCRATNIGEQTVLIRVDAGRDFYQTSTLEVRETAYVLSEKFDSESQLWFEIEKPDGTRGFVASWLVVKVDCLPVEIVGNNGENCTTLYRYHNLIFEESGLIRNSDELTIPQILQIVELLDRNIQSSFWQDRVVVIYIIPNNKEMMRIYPDRRSETATGVAGEVIFDGCYLQPPGTNVVNFYFMAMVVDGSIASSLVHELSHLMGAGHGEYGGHANDGTAPVRELDAYYWGTLFAVAIVHDCNLQEMTDIFHLGEQEDIERCHEIQLILNL